MLKRKMGITCSLILLTGCSAPGSPLPTASGGASPHAVTAEYTPGTVSIAPVIQHAQKAFTALTLIGTGVAGDTDGAAAQATLTDPESVAVAPDGTVYVAEPYSYRIRRIAPDGTVSTLAGGGNLPGRTDGVGSQASFMGPSDLALAPDGSLYVADFDSVRKVTPEGQVTTLTLKNTDGSEYQPIELFGIALDKSGRLYLSNTYWIDRVDPDGTVHRFAGEGEKGFADGQGTNAYFNLPRKLAFDGNGNLYVADYGNQRIRCITPGGTVTTVAGTGILGYVDGPADQSQLNFPMGVACDASGDVLISDTYNQAIRELTPDHQVRTIAGNNSAGFADGSGNIQFDRPMGLAVRADGAIVVADTENQRIRILK